MSAVLTPDTLREAVAEGIWRRLAPDHHLDWADEPDQEKYRCMADAALRAIVQAAQVDGDELGDQAKELAAEAEREHLLNLGDHALLGRVATLLRALAEAAEREGGR